MILQSNKKYAKEQKFSTHFLPESPPTFTNVHGVCLVSHPFFCSLSEVAFTPFTGAKLLEYQCESVKGMLSCPFHPFTKLFIGTRVEEEFLKVEEALEMVEEE